MTLSDFISPQRNGEDHDRDDNKHQTGKRPLSSAKTAHDLRTAARTDARCLADSCMAMRTNQRLHKATISQARSRYERILFVLLHFLDSNAGYYTALSSPVRR